MRKGDFLFCLIVLFLVVYFAIALYGKTRKCEELGGVLVAGIGKFQCVKSLGAL